MTSLSEVIAGVRSALRSFAIASSVSLWLAVTPVPASRPRVGKFGTYYAKGYQTFLKQATDVGRVLEDHPELKDVPVVVEVDCIIDPPKKTIRLWPGGDVDNYAKGPLDVLTKLEKLWRDDTNVQGLIVWKRFAQPNETSGIGVTVLPVEVPPPHPSR